MMKRRCLPCSRSLMKCRQSFLIPPEQLSTTAELRAWPGEGRVPFCLNAKPTSMRPPIDGDFIFPPLATSDHGLPHRISTTTLQLGRRWWLLLKNQAIEGALPSTIPWLGRTRSRFFRLGNYEARDPPDESCMVLHCAGNNDMMFRLGAASTLTSIVTPVSSQIPRPATCPGTKLCPHPILEPHRLPQT